jgi:hypothetical protein
MNSGSARTDIAEDAVRRATRVLRSAAAVLGACAFTAALGQQPELAGTWEWTRKKDGCVERFVFRDNGTVAITRGEKRTENTYLRAWTPEPNGRFRLTITTVKDHGGRDCEGATDDSTGRRSVVYVLFSQSRESMIFCAAPEGTDCTGLMRRIAR